MSSSLPLNLDRAGRSDTWPVTQGVPFPDGELPTSTPVAVRAPDGRLLPTQASCLATWGPDRSYVKWLLIDFRADATTDTSSPYVLEYGDDVETVEHETPIRIDNEGGSLVVSSDAIELTFDSTSPDFLPRWKILHDGGEEDILRGSTGLHLYMKDDRSEYYDSTKGSLSPEITVEETGALRTCIRVRGYHAGDNGQRFCPYELRMHIYAGSPDVRLLHTYVFDQEPDSVRISSMGIRLPVKTGGAVRATVGGENTIHRSDHFDAIELCQLTDESCRISVDGRIVDEGYRAPGWCCMNGSESGLAVALRESWQEYPKGLRLQPDAVDIQLHPETAQPIDYANPYKEQALRFDSMRELSDEEFTSILSQSATAPLNLKSIGLGHKDFGMSDEQAGERVRMLIKKYAANRTYCFCDTGSGKAYGSAKTHEVWIRSASRPIDEDEAAAFSRAVQEPLLALPSPEYVCGTGAVRLAHPVDTENFGAIEEALELLFDRLVLEPQEICRIYGSLNYGELINGHTKANQIIYRNFREAPSRWNDIVRTVGTFNNEAQDLIYQLWVYYLRTGQRKYFRFAEAKSEHTEDVDFIHKDPKNERIVGLMHYHNVFDWSGGPSPSHSLIGGLMLHYYLTGNRRAFDVARGAADNAVRAQTIGGVVRGKGLNREVTGPLMTLLEVYEATWEKRYRDVIDTTLAVIRRASDGQTGALPVSLYTGIGAYEDEVWAEGVDNRTDYPGGMLFHILFESHRLFATPWIRDWIIRIADSWLYDVRCDDYIPAELTRPEPGKPTESIRVNKLNDSWYWRSFLDYSNNYFDPVVALAYRITDDPKYLGYLNHRAEIFPERAREAYELHTCETFNAINHWGDAVPAVMGALANVQPELLQKAKSEWKAERARTGHTVYEGDRRGFDKNGNAAGVAMNIELQAYGARDPERKFLFRFPGDAETGNSVR
jgi:hypothetical protein